MQSKSDNKRKDLAGGKVTFKVWPGDNIYTELETSSAEFVSRH